MNSGKTLEPKLASSACLDVHSESQDAPGLHPHGPHTLRSGDGDTGDAENATADLGTLDDSPPVVVAGQFRFWSNDLERMNEPPHVHVADTEGGWESRIGLVTGQWLDDPPPTDADVVLKAFRKHRMDCLEAWDAKHRSRRFDAEIERRCSGWRTLAPLLAGHVTGLRERLAAARFEDGGRDPFVVVDSMNRDMRFEVSREPPEGLVWSDEAVKFFLPLDWLLHAEDAEYRVRMTEVRLTGAALTGALIRRRRQSRRLKREDVAWPAGVALHVLDAIEAGRAEFDLRELEKIAAVLGQRVQNLLLDRYVTDVP